MPKAAAKRRAIVPSEPAAFDWTLTHLRTNHVTKRPPKLERALWRAIERGYWKAVATALHPDDLLQRAWLLYCERVEAPIALSVMRVERTYRVTARLAVHIPQIGNDAMGALRILMGPHKVDLGETILSGGRGVRCTHVFVDFTSLMQERAKNRLLDALDVDGPLPVDTRPENDRFEELPDLTLYKMLAVMRVGLPARPDYTGNT